MGDGFTARKFAWLEAVARDANLRPSAARLAIILVKKYTNREEFLDSGTLIAWPSVDTLASILGMTPRGVQKVTDSLVERGHLDRRIGGGWKVTNRYTLRFKDKKPRTAVQGNGSKPRTGVHPLETETPNRRSEKPRTGVHPNSLKEIIEEKESPYSPLSSQKPSKHKAQKLDSNFIEFWQHYPRKVGRKTAERAFAKAVKEGADPKDIIAGAMRYAAERDGQEPQFTKHPSTWLNAGCWEDEPAPQLTGSQQPNRRMSAAEFVQRREAAINKGDWK